MRILSHDFVIAVVIANRVIPTTVRLADTELQSTPVILLITLNLCFSSACALQ